MGNKADEAPITDAVAVVERYRVWYGRAKDHMRRWDNLLQTVIILAAGATTLLVAVDEPKWEIEIAAVLATVAASLNAVFRFRAKYVAFATAGEQLKFELAEFHAKSDAERQLVRRARKVVEAEIREWSALHAEGKPPEAAPPGDKPAEPPT